MFILNQLI